jgi:predicted GNAT family acetyltransferase
MEHIVQQHESGSKGAFFIAGAGGGRLAQMTYSRTSETLIIIDHTEVDPSLAGQGIGRKLLDALVGWARSSATKVIPLCPYAKAQFGKDASIRDVLQA